jgi:hypothetical protein
MTPRLSAEERASEIIVQLGIEHHIHSMLEGKLKARFTQAIKQAEAEAYERGRDLAIQDSFAEGENAGFCQGFKDAIEKAAKAVEYYHVIADPEAMADEIRQLKANK